MKVICKVCGKVAKVDKEKSNENWTVYDTKSKCECGACDYTVEIDESK